MGEIEVIEARELSQKDVMRVLRIKQPEASRLVNGKLSRFSRERLIDYMVRLGMTVELKVRKPRKTAPLRPGALIYAGASRGALPTPAGKNSRFTARG